MLNINNLSVHFSGRYLFSDLSCNINKTDRIGLIGRNGTGKSTLLKIIAGHQSAESGSINTPNDYTIGYLPQDIKVESEKSVYDEAYTALDEIIKLNEANDKLSKEIANRDDYESEDYGNLIEELNRVNDRLNILGGHSIQAEIEKILNGLGFKKSDMQRSLKEFSGGWKMRVELAKILLRKPDCVLLDEPTNHLDIESIIWLENFLKAYPGAIIIVSHDRTFLDNITNRTIELFAGKSFDMPVKYSVFVERRNEQREQQLAAYQNQQKQIAQTERFIERFRSKNTLATRVQSKIKALDKLERIQVDEEDTESINLRFPEPPRSGQDVVKLENLSKSYGDLLVLDNIDLELERGEKIAFVGKNGEGKSTLSKIIAGNEPYEGSLKLGHNVEISYFSQHQADLMDSNSTVFEVIDNAATGEMRTKVRSLLGAFLFSGDSVYKKVKVLSGGERSRLALAKLMLHPMNLLILDEPTNHLDMKAKDILKEALINFQGTLIIVSHDRDFLDGLTDKTLLFKDRKIKTFLGDINYFLEKQNIENLQNLEKNKSQEYEKTKQSEAQNDRLKRKELQREKGRIEKQIAKIESQIEDLETKINECEELFSNPEFFNDVENAKIKQDEYNLFKAENDTLMVEWDKLSSQLESIESQL